MEGAGRRRPLDAAGAIPVVDGTSESGLRIATGALLDGQDVLLYPGGFIPMVSQPVPARQGAALLAIRTGTDIVPMGEYGTVPSRALGSSFTARLLGPQPRAAIAYGEPIPTHHLDPGDPRDVMALTALLERRQRELGEEARAHVIAAQARH